MLVAKTDIQICLTDKVHLVIWQRTIYYTKTFSADHCCISTLNLTSLTKAFICQELTKATNTPTYC